MASPAAQGLIERFLSRLERPLLFKLAAGLFLVSLFVPDPIPFLDELLFAIVTLLLTRQKAIDVSTTTGTTAAAPPQNHSGTSKGVPSISTHGTPKEVPSTSTHGTSTEVPSSSTR